MPVLLEPFTSIDLFLTLHATDVAVGSTVTIRHVNTQGGYLHSHPHSYPGGSERAYLALFIDFPFQRLNRTTNNTLSTPRCKQRLAYLQCFQRRNSL